MTEQKFLMKQFDANRTHLRNVAYRMLGSLSEADDAVQEAWLPLRRSDTSPASLGVPGSHMRHSLTGRSESSLGPHGQLSIVLVFTIRGS
jgi:Sigma-70 region 2